MSGAAVPDLPDGDADGQANGAGGARRSAHLAGPGSGQHRERGRAALHLEILRALSAKRADEAAHRLIMALLGKQGRPREAIAQYDACREILQT